MTRPIPSDAGRAPGAAPPVGATGAGLGPLAMLAGGPAKMMLASIAPTLRSWFEEAPDPELVDMGARIVRELGGLPARRLAMHVLVASVLELEGFEPSGLRVFAQDPRATGPQSLRGSIGWVPLPPT